MTERTSLLYQITEIGGRYSAVPDGAGWCVLNVETGRTLPGAFSDEASANRGARTQAAVDILDLVEGRTR